MTHQKLISEITCELYNDENALALILYGSLARDEGGANSDIDLLVITKEICLAVGTVLCPGVGTVIGIVVGAGVGIFLSWAATGVPIGGPSGKTAERYANDALNATLNTVFVG